MNMIMDGLTAVGEALGMGGEPESIREEYIQPERVTQPAPDIKEVEAENYDELDEFDFTLMDGTKGSSTDFNPWEGEEFNLRNESDQEANVRLQEEMYGEAAQGFENDTLGVKVTQQTARKEHTKDIMKMENGAEVGLIKTTTEEKFMPIDSIEGTGPDASMSTQEIGYGIKIPKSWLGKDKSKWPKVQGVTLDIKKGITKEQAEAMMSSELEKSYKAAEPKLSKWRDMTEKEKVFWADLTYNGGAKAINKNPKAKAAANLGNTVEGMILALDFIKAGGKASRGLLNRRISMYNQAALEITGAPVIEEYEFGKDIKIKFSSHFMTDKVSKKLAKKVKANEGWLTISKGGDREGVKFEANDNYKFER